MAEEKKETKAKKPAEESKAAAEKSKAESKKTTDKAETKKSSTKSGSETAAKNTGAKADAKKSSAKAGGEAAAKKTGAKADAKKSSTKSGSEAAAKNTGAKADAKKSGTKTAGESAVKNEAALNPTLQKKKERREAKAARKEANRVEEKKTRPNNLVLAIIIFGVLIGMFAFVGGYNYFSKAANIEKYMEDSGMLEMYKDFEYDEYTRVKIKPEKNTIKIVMKVAEDAPKEEVEKFKGEEGTESLKQMGAYFLTSTKPETRAIRAQVKVAVKQGDETINYVKMSYREAKKYLEELQEKAESESRDPADGEENHVEIESDVEVENDVQIESEVAEPAEGEAAEPAEGEAASE